MPPALTTEWVWNPDWKSLQEHVRLYNTRTRSVEPFRPLHPPHVGIYVCGPTVYSDPHLGHARAGIVFDVLRRFFQKIEYKVRFVSNITDVGHLEGDTDEGEDKIQKQARLRKLEPIQIAQYYTRVYMEMMKTLNVLPPDIQPHATCHIAEQIEFIERILEKKFAYVSRGSVYFDVPRFAQIYGYGMLSGRKLEEVLHESRELRGTEEKRHPADFALWKQAPPQHIMKWKSPWSIGFPGWHIECTVMSLRYLGFPFDIHGGGLDLTFPHHECEIMQAQAVYGEEPVRYWIHNNLITIQGQKMSKSLGNFITIQQALSGEHPFLSRGYPPPAIRLLILQTHYRSVIDFSDDALKSSLRAYNRLRNACSLLFRMVPSSDAPTDPDFSLIDTIATHILHAWESLCDDLNTARTLGHLFELLPEIHRLYESEGTEIRSLPADILTRWQEHFRTLLEEVLGISLESSEGAAPADFASLMELLLEVRMRLRQERQYPLADWIREELYRRFQIRLQDSPEGTRWMREL